MPDNEVPLNFPVLGIDRSTQYQEQPQDTCADAVNVRGFEAETDRLRGGTRPGLEKLLGERVVGLSEVQHLNMIVTVDGEALGANFPLGDFPDPSDGDRNPGRNVPTGGDATQPNRNIGNAQEPPNLFPSEVTSGVGNSYLMDVGGGVGAKTVKQLQINGNLPADTKAIVVQLGGNKFRMQVQTWL